MKRDIVSYVAKCLPCQKVNTEHKHLDGSLYPLEIPTQKWYSISMDFITSLPKTRFQHDSIFMVVNRLIKVAHFILGNTIDDCMMVTKRFVKDVFYLHGFLENIILDRDSKLTFEFWQTLHKEVGTQLNFSSSYHPELDGQIERVNQVLEDMLKMYYMDQKTKWEDYLHLVEFTYNITFQTSLGMVPYLQIILSGC